MHKDVPPTVSETWKGRAQRLRAGRVPVRRWFGQATPWHPLQCLHMLSADATQELGNLLLLPAPQNTPDMAPQGPDLAKATPPPLPGPLPLTRERASPGSQNTEIRGSDSHEWA